MNPRPPTLTYYRSRWPEHEVPQGEPVWLFYEVDEAANSVLRTVELFPDERVTRNSIELEQRSGDSCPSLVECSLDELLFHPTLEEITREQFEDFWRKGVDTPFWFPAN